MSQWRLMGDTYDTTVCFGRRRPGLQNGRKTLEIPINKPPYSSKNRSIIPINDVKNTKLGNFHQSHGRKIWIFKKTSKSVENPKNKAALQIQSKKIQWEHNCLSVDNFGYILTFITFISYIFFCFLIESNKIHTSSAFAI